MLEEIKLSKYIEVYGEHWADELPENCPPEDVCVSKGDVFYRLTQNEDRIIPQDWFNYLTLFPGRFKGRSLIKASGLSLFDSIDSLENTRKLPSLKDKKGTAQISLIPKDGVIINTAGHHYTWWRTTNCDLTKAHNI